MSDDVSKAIETAYDEVRSFVDYQLDVTDKLDEELLTLMKFTILLIGAVYPVFEIIVSPDNQLIFIRFLPWLVLAIAVLIYTAIFTAKSYRDGFYYAGYEDSPFLDFESVTGAKAVKGLYKEDHSKVEFSSDREFYIQLLNDYSVGIAHNNTEIRFKSQLMKHVFTLITLGVVIFAIGVVISVFPDVGPLGSINVNTGVFVLMGMVSFCRGYDAYNTYQDYSDREDDEDRLAVSDYEDG